MTNYSLAANRTASDMDGAGTDLATTDTVTTNAFKLTLDIDCEFEKITVSASGELEIDGHSFVIDDVAGAGVFGLAGSVISSPNLSDASRALFFSRAGMGVLPNYPYSFRALGSLSLAFCHMLGNKWSMYGSSVALELPYGSCMPTKSTGANLVRNHIQGSKTTSKGTGHRGKAISLSGSLFNDDIALLDTLDSYLTGNLSFSLITDRFFLQDVIIADLRVIPASKDVSGFTLSVVEV